MLLAGAAIQDALGLSSPGQLPADDDPDDVTDGAAGRAVTGTPADAAELDVLVWGGRHRLLRAPATLPCLAQPSPPPGTPYPCPHLQGAIREVCDWREARILLTRGDARVAENEAA